MKRPLLFLASLALTAATTMAATFSCKYYNIEPPDDSRQVTQDHDPYDDNVGINITETCDLYIYAVYKYDGKEREDGWAFPYTINQTSTGVNDLNVTVTSKAVKTIENGQLVITKDGKRYNVAGQLMK